MNMRADTRCGRRWRLMPAGNINRKYVRSPVGQATVELALIAPIVSFVLVVAVQFAIIGSAALALGQANYEGARFASINTTATQSQVQTYMLSVASPIISAGSGRYLSSTVTPAPPCSWGGSVTVSVSFDTSHLVMLPNPFFGVKFPTSLSNSETAFCE